MKIKILLVYMDSELVVRQVNGRYKINAKHLQEYKTKINELSQKISFKIAHVKREYNKTADYLSKLAIKK